MMMAKKPIGRHPTGVLFASCSTALSQLMTATTSPLVRVPHEAQADGFPLYFAQQRLWFLDQLQPGGAAYNMPGAVLLDGPLDIAALAAALSAVARRHESLRTRFASRGGRPVQIVASHAKAETALGMTMMIETALKKASAMFGRPVANMWCNQTPKPSTIVSTVASATAV